MSNNDKLAFVITRLDDIGYPSAPAIKIFADGRVEGLGDKFTISNRIPMLIGMAKDEEARRVLGMSKTQDHPPSGQVAGVEQKASQAATDIRNTQAKEAYNKMNEAPKSPPPVDHVVAFFDGMDKLFKEHFEPLFMPPRRRG